MYSVVYSNNKNVTKEAKYHKMAFEWQYYVQYW